MALLAVIFVLGSGGSSILWASDMAVTQTFRFSPAELKFGSYNGYDMISLDYGGYLSERGAPMLPIQTVRIALPDGMAAQEVTVISSELVEITGNYNILPAQPPVAVGAENPPPFVAPLPEVYSSNEPFPQQPVTLQRQLDLAGQGMAELEICPLVYYPAQGKLMMYTSLTLTIEGDGGYVCGDYLPVGASEKTRQEYRTVLTSIVSNPEDVTLRETPLALRRSSALSGGPYEHVIITSDAYAPLYEPLVTWHTKKGVKDTVVTTTSIYADYTGADNQEKIRNFVIDAHNTWGTQYILIGGEHGTVPFEYRTYSGDNIPSDQYYGDFDDDWIYEVYVGRVTAEGSTQINCFLDKVLLYEKNPPRDNYPLDACILGMDLTLESQPPYYTLTRSEDLKKSINSAYIPAQFDVTTVYDTELDNHKTKFINALNDGQNLVNHSDHSNYYCMGTGDLNHGSYLFNSDVNNLTNNNRMSNIFSLGCHSMELDHNDCIAEYFVIYNNLQAGVSFTGNTRSGWFYVGNPASLSGFLDLYWWRGIFTYNRYRLGEALAWTKDNTTHSGDWLYCQWTLNLLGEPEMPLWTDTIKLMVVAHPDSFSVQQSTFTVHVDDSLGNPLESAFVCIWKGDEIYDRAFTDASGDVTFPIAPVTHGSMSITVTAQNYLPYEGTSECVGNLSPVAGFTFTPSLPTRHDTVYFTSTSYDNDGSIVSWAWNFGDDSLASEENVAHLYADYGTYTVTLIVEDDGGVADTVQADVTVKPICGDVNDDNSGPNVTDVTYLVAFLFKSGPPPYSQEAADVNGDGDVNVADLTTLAAYLFQSGPPLTCN